MSAALHTGNIQKGGALLDDSRRLIETWDLEETVTENLDRITSGNLLGKATRRRSEDLLRRSLRPRLVEPGMEVLATLKELLDDPAALSAALYYETSRDETLLAAFAEGPLFDWYHAGRNAVTIDDTTAWIAELTATGSMPTTTATVRTKVARGLLAALRDFGVLEGAANKRFAHPHLPLRGFVYVAYRLHDQGASSTTLVTSAVWRRWLLDRDRIDDLLYQAARGGILDYGVVGSAVRVDWHVANLKEAVRAAA